MPKPRGRPKGSQTEPPVSLSPLEPEEALAGLMQVKPEAKENEMPKFSAGDRVRVPRDKEHVPMDFLGREATIMRVEPLSQDEPGGPEKQAYTVQFDGDNAPKIAEEDWLELESESIR